MKMFQCGFTAAQIAAVLVLPRILTWIRDSLGALAIVNPEEELLPRIMRLKDDCEVHGLKGGRQKVIEFEIKVQGLEIRVYVAVENSMGQSDWLPVSSSWTEASVGCPPFTGDDIHFHETHLVCPECGDMGEAWRFELNRTCSCGQTLWVANVADIN